MDLRKEIHLPRPNLGALELPRPKGLRLPRRGAGSSSDGTPAPARAERRSRGRKPSGCVGLDIDGDSIAAVMLRDGHVERAVSAGLAPGLVRDGEVADADGLGAALKEIFRREGLPREIRLGVANAQIQVRQLELPPIPDETERDAAVRFQAEEAIAMPIDDTVLDYSPLGAGETPEGAPTERFMLVAARRSMVAAFADAARAAGLRPQGIDLNAFALVRALAGGASADDPPCAYVHLGGVGQLTVAAGETCLFTRTLGASGGGDLHLLADEVRMSIDYYRGQPGSPPVERLRVSGPGSTAVDSGELAALVGLISESVEPLGGLSPSELPDGEDPRCHTVALGLALGARA